MKLKDIFFFMGGLNALLIEKKIVSLILRGFSKDQIYEFGCDLVYFYNAK